MEYFTILTFNISEVNSNLSKINKDELLDNLSKILEPNLKNIYFISSQEDEIYSKFLFYIKKLFYQKDYYFYESTYVSPYAKIIGNNYNIHSLVIIPIHIMKSNNIKIETIKKINHNAGYTKGSIIIKISDKYNDVYLISSHLPMSNKTSDLGYDKREKSVIDVLKYVNNKMNQYRSNYLLWTGDLNFRIDLNNNSEDRDQIKRLLIPKVMSKLSIKLQDLSQINNNQPTCKTVMKNEKIYCDEMCDMKKSCNTCYDVNSKKGLRIPSYCDRVLGWSNVGPFIDYETFTLSAKDYPFIKFSDHNPIISNIKLPIPNDRNYDEEDNLIGGNIYINKYNKYIQKYKYLLNKD
jgi:hypothetical protein